MANIRFDELSRTHQKQKATTSFYNTMLDFYLIKDEQKKPNAPEKLGLVYIGGLEAPTFENLQNKGLIDQQFDYYSDFRWKTERIHHIQQNIAQKRLQADTDVIKLTQLLAMAAEKQCGLIAFAD